MVQGIRALQILNAVVKQVLEECEGKREEMQGEGFHALFYRHTYDIHKHEDMIKIKQT